MNIVTDRDDSEPEVMTSLPRSRPVRRSSKRGERPAVDGARSSRATPAKATAQARPRAATATKPKATATRGAASNASAAARRPPRSTPRPRPAAAHSPTTAPAAARSPDESRTLDVPRAPRGTSASTAPPHAEPARKVPAAGYAAPSERVDENGSPVTELVTTTVLAASELAQIGLDIGRSALRSMIDRLPKP